MKELRTIINDFKKLNDRKIKLNDFAIIGKLIYLNKKLNLNALSFVFIVMIGLVFKSDYLAFVGQSTYNILHFEKTDLGISDLFFLLIFWISLYNLIVAAIKRLSYREVYNLNDVKKEDALLFLRCYEENKKRNEELQNMFYALLDQYDEYCSQHDMDEIRTLLYRNEIKVLDHLNDCLFKLKNKKY